MNANAAKLTEQQVQHARDLVRARFRTASIGRAFGVCPRAITNILKGKSWRTLADVARPLPLLAPNAALKLKLRTFAKLTPEQRDVVEQYSQRLASELPDAEREQFALSLLSVWTPRRPVPRREMRSDRTEGVVVADPVGAGHNS